MPLKIGKKTELPSLTERAWGPVDEVNGVNKVKDLLCVCFIRTTRCGATRASTGLWA